MNDDVNCTRCHGSGIDPNGGEYSIPGDPGLPAPCPACSVAQGGFLNSCANDGRECACHGGSDPCAGSGDQWRMCPDCRATTRPCDCAEVF